MSFSIMYLRVMTEKTLAHEWAHLRWGLFDEYPIDAQDAEFCRYDSACQPTR